MTIRPPERLLRLAAKCPECRRPPALRTTDRERRLHLEVSPDRPVLSYQCQSRRCGATYWIKARAYHLAD